MAWRFAFLILAGCWTGSAAPPPPPAVGNNTPVVPLPPPPPKTTTWEGRYVCIQGVTALRLELQHQCMPHSVGEICGVNGTFQFGPLAQNPNVSTGSFKVVGEVRTNANGQLLMIVEPESWIEQPGNYEMVGFTASTDRDHRTLDGHIDYPGCAAINLTRID